MPSVSLVIPCFNAAGLVGDAVRSAMTQTRPPDEIIVVDDGSTDNSGAAAEAAGPVLVLRTCNGGISAARNAGIAASRGDLIAFLDADDLWPPASLESRLRFCTASCEPDYIYGGVECFDDATGAIIGTPEPGRLAGALLVRRGAFETIGPFDTGLRTGETIDWIARADAIGYRAAATEEIVLRRRVHAKNVTRDSTALHADYLKVLRRNLHRRRDS